MAATRISRRRAIGTAAATATLGSLGLAGPLAARSPPGILGQQAPALKVPYWIGADGAPTRIDPRTMDGQYVVLKFFQSWCPGCHKHGFPALQRIAAAFGDEPRVTLLAVQTVFEGFYTNTRDKLRSTQERYDLTLPFGHDEGDPDGDHRPRTMRDYRSGGTPWIVVVVPSGTVVFNDFHIDAGRFVDWLSEQLAA